jgi:hypothetical protein
MERVMGKVGRQLVRASNRAAKAARYSGDIAEFNKLAKAAEGKTQKAVEAKSKALNIARTLKKAGVKLDVPAHLLG